MAATLGVWIGSPAAHGQVEFPPDQASWINAPPLSADALLGKGVVLFFFEKG